MDSEITKAEFDQIFADHLDAIEESPDGDVKKLIFRDLLVFLVTNAALVQKDKSLHSAIPKKADDLTFVLRRTDPVFADWIERCMWLIDGYTEKSDPQAKFERAICCDDIVTAIEMVDHPDVDPSIDNNIALVWGCANGFTSFVTQLLRDPRVRVTREAIDHAQKFRQTSVLKLLKVM